MSQSKDRCECADPGCHVHAGESKCRRPGADVLFRVDMDDVTGTMFCAPCAEDAQESGVFA